MTVVVDFGTPTFTGRTLDSADESLAAQTMAALQTEWAVAANQVTTKWAADAAAKTANLALLNQTKKLIDGLPAQLAKVRAGEKSFPWWANFALELHRSIVQVVGDVGTWSLTGVLSKAAGQTVADVGDVVEEVKDAVSSAGGGFGIGALLGLLGGAYVVWRLSK